MITVFALIRLFVQYLLQPISLVLTFFLPIAIYFINRKFIWFSILLVILVELIINWGNFCYYKSRGIMILFTLGQIAVMAIIILILGAVAFKRKR